MLTQLTIHNFGLIDKVSLELTSGLNILTGETGAGKSILIDALRIALGERFAPSFIRDQKKAGIIEAVFDLSSKELCRLSVFEHFLSEDETTLIIHRSHQENSKSKIKINGFAATVGQLKEIGNHLIDFHGPHDHQMLLCAESHKGMLDRLISFDTLLINYQKIYTDYTTLKQQKEKLQELSTSRERELDMLSHQLKELEQVPLDEKKYSELLQKQTQLNNFEKLNDCLTQLTDLMENDTQGISERIRQTFSPMNQLNQIDEQTTSFMHMLTQLQETNEQLSTDIRDYAENLSFDPQEAQLINTTWDAYDTIKRKYGPSIEEAQKFYTASKEKYNLLANFEQENNNLHEHITDLEKKLKQIAKKITAKRQKASVQLKTTIEKELNDLGIAHVKFEARMEKNNLTEDGQDNVIFYISPNLGEDLKPLANIVSSGEAARVMLALKKALINVDPIPILLFDEIDAQIGGRLGTITGQKLKDISQNRQIILITHLPQIASFADTHLKVIKTTKNDRTLTNVTSLNKEERLKEIAKMMSGEEETGISLKHAKDMLSKASV